MQKRRTRNRAERVLGLWQVSLAILLALGLGFALTSACKAHVTAGPDQTLTARSNDDEPVGDLLRPNGERMPGNPEKESWPVPPSIYSEGLEVSVDGFRRDVESCNMPALRRSILSQSEFASLAANPPPDEDTYQKMVERWLATVVQLFCTPLAPGTGRHLGGLATKDVVLMPENSEWKQRLVLAFIKFPVLIQTSGRLDPEPKGTAWLVLVDFEGSWRIFLRKQK